MQLDAPVLWLVMQGSACMYVYIKSRSIYWLYSCKSSSTDAEGAARCSAMRSLADCLDASSSCDLRARVTGAHFTCFTGTKVQTLTQLRLSLPARKRRCLKGHCAFGLKGRCACGCSGCGHKECWRKQQRGWRLDGGGRRWRGGGKAHARLLPRMPSQR